MKDTKQYDYNKKSNRIHSFTSIFKHFKYTFLSKLKSVQLKEIEKRKKKRKRQENGKIRTDRVNISYAGAQWCNGKASGSKSRVGRFDSSEHQMLCFCARHFIHIAKYSTQEDLCL